MADPANDQGAKKEKREKENSERFNKEESNLNWPEEDDTESRVTKVLKTSNVSEMDVFRFAKSIMLTCGIIVVILFGLSFFASKMYEASIGQNVFKLAEYTVLLLLGYYFGKSPKENGK